MDRRKTLARIPNATSSLTSRSGSTNSNPVQPRESHVRLHTPARMVAASSRLRTLCPKSRCLR
jgi:hypothetical protein